MAHQRLDDRVGRRHLPGQRRQRAVRIRRDERQGLLHRRRRHARPRAVGHQPEQQVRHPHRARARPRQRRPRASTTRARSPTATSSTTSRPTTRSPVPRSGARTARTLARAWSRTSRPGPAASRRPRPSRCAAAWASCAAVRSRRPPTGRPPGPRCSTRSTATDTGRTPPSCSVTAGTSSAASRRSGRRSGARTAAPPAPSR